MNVRYYIRKIKDVKLREYFNVFPMLTAVVLSPFLKAKYKDIWAVSERAEEARDNGYCFFKYLSQEHREIPCVYLIDKKCDDYNKVKDLGNIVQFGSLSHWLIYFNCKYLISSQSGKPSPYLCTLLERTRLYQPYFVFLQHGITINKAPYLMANQMHVDVFTTGAVQETEFVRSFFGYKDNTVQYTGFARFDDLQNANTVRNRIMVMPTWRKWLRFKSEEHADASGDISGSEYIRCWRNLLQSIELDRLVQKHNLEIIFVPHPNMRDLIEVESILGSSIKSIDSSGLDLQELLRTSEMIITDYSSVFFDIAYMKRPIIFYQFDEKLFRRYHYPEGWFDYRSNAMGIHCTTQSEVILQLKTLVENRFQVSKAFLEEHKKTFRLYDSNNSERIYKYLAKKELNV